MRFSRINRSILTCLRQVEKTHSYVLKENVTSFSFTTTVSVNNTSSQQSHSLQTLSHNCDCGDCDCFHSHRLDQRSTATTFTTNSHWNKQKSSPYKSNKVLTQHSSFHRLHTLIEIDSMAPQPPPVVPTPGIKSRSIMSQSTESGAKCQVLSCRHKLDTFPEAAAGGDSSNDSQLDVEETDFDNIVTASSSCLLKGGVIAVPTDTIYGVACLAQNVDAIERIYRIKGRNHEKPVAISVGCIDDIYKWSNVTVSREVLTDLLPGPVTVVFERSPELNLDLNPHTHLVGVRIPKHDYMQRLATACEGPIALTSANVSGSSSCLQIQEFENLWSQLDLVVNGGILSDTEESRQGSTVVDLSVKGTFRIIRPGSAHQPTVSCLQVKYGLKPRQDSR